MDLNEAEAVEVTRSLEVGPGVVDRVGATIMVLHRHFTIILTEEVGTVKTTHTARIIPRGVPSLTPIHTKERDPTIPTMEMITTIVTSLTHNAVLR